VAVNVLKDGRILLGKVLQPPCPCETGTRQKMLEFSLVVLLEFSLVVLPMPSPYHNNKSKNLTKCLAISDKPN